MSELPHGTRTGKWRHRRDRDPDAGGCLHDAALLAFPELALLVDLHLADSETGEPMHAEANGLYFCRTARPLRSSKSCPPEATHRSGKITRSSGVGARIRCHAG